MGYRTVTTKLNDSPTLDDGTSSSSIPDVDRQKLIQTIGQLGFDTTTLDPLIEALGDDVGLLDPFLGELARCLTDDSRTQTPGRPGMPEKDGLPGISASEHMALCRQYREFSADAKRRRTEEEFVHGFRCEKKQNPDLTVQDYQTANRKGE